MTSLVFSRQLTVEHGHCGPAGTVFTRCLFEYFDANSWMLLEAALGVKRQNINASFGIFGVPLVDARADFLRPVKFGDVIDIASRVVEFRRSSFKIEHRVTTDRELAVLGGEIRVWAVHNKDDPDKISPLTIPTKVIARFGLSSEI